MVFTVIEGGSLARSGYTERVDTNIIKLRTKLYLVTWKEQSGATVTHIEDHENGIAYYNITLPDGRLYTMRGTIWLLENK
ncbi:hypothetical protein HX021_13630 [Sphingobacterium sp. N143]|uniref:MoaF-related domain-containing protein n=1 Tax=Sphingobacterium sp. N143 TaxID=2746727 RepID=UPI002576AF07|nr:hypothetical protein [Sphingobacterium sp. N143]MDM1295324.1 hypothetical protein [Sphingobacterium sp. N143]